MYTPQILPHWFSVDGCLRLFEFFLADEKIFLRRIVLSTHFYFIITIFCTCAIIILGNCLVTNCWRTGLILHVDTHVHCQTTLRKCVSVSTTGCVLLLPRSLIYPGQSQTGVTVLVGSFLVTYDYSCTWLLATCVWCVVGDIPYLCPLLVHLDQHTGCRYFQFVLYHLIYL